MPAAGSVTYWVRHLQTGEHEAWPRLIGTLYEKESDR